MSFESESSAGPRVHASPSDLSPTADVAAESAATEQLTTAAEQVAVAPEASAPKVSKPKISEVGASEPEVSKSEISEAEASKPEAAKPQIAEPEPEPEPEPEEVALALAPDSLRPALLRRGFEKLTAVQEAVANADDGRRDLRISSQTGSGKTVAIGFALVERLVQEPRVGPTTLIIAPTRELAMQVKEECAWLFAGIQGVRCEVVTGGTNLERERMRLRSRPSVLVGTPGRLLDHLRRGSVDISSVTQLVLDEADQMLDLGFKDELDGILDCLPEERRTHLVSATFPRAVLELANRFQNHPVEIEGTAPGDAHDDIEHLACRIGNREHYQAVVNLLLMAGQDRTLVFVRTREETTRMADKLTADGFAAAAINGDLAQAQRTRTLAGFRNGATRTLIATDVAARGLDIPSVTMVIHVEQPIDSATYVHRSGRTGRAGQKGRSVLLVPKPRAGRTTRMFRELRIEARWTWAPTAETINKKQLERTEADALLMLATAHAATPEKRAAAANLLQERDPVEVVAALLSKTMTQTRKPFDMQQPSRPDAAGPRTTPVRSMPPRSMQTGAGHMGGDSTRPVVSRPTASRPTATTRPAVSRPAVSHTESTHSAPPERSNRIPADRRGQPGAAPSWQRNESQRNEQPRDQSPPADQPEAGFTRFRINWGVRDGANPRRILAHVCRRGEIDSQAIGSISMDGDSSTFEVANGVVEGFASCVRERDRRDPHLIIHRETFDRGAAGQRGHGGGRDSGRGNYERPQRNDDGGGFRGARGGNNFGGVRGGVRGGSGGFRGNRPYR